MSKARIYKGIKVKTWNGTTKNVPYSSFEVYQESENDTWGHEFVEKELELYLCGIFIIDNNLSELYDFRESLDKGKGYLTLLNKSEIQVELQREGALVAVKGLGEIESIEELGNI